MAVADVFVGSFVHQYSQFVPAFEMVEAAVGFVGVVVEAADIVFPVFVEAAADVGIAKAVVEAAVGFVGVVVEAVVGVAVC